MRPFCLTAAVAAAVALIPASAQAAATTCTFSASTATMTVSIAAEGDDGATLGRAPGGALQYDGQACGGATVFTTDRIRVVDLDDSQSFAFAHTLTIDLGNGRLGPGKTAEPAPAVSEIEISAQMGGGMDRLVVRGSRSTAAGDAIRAGSLGTALNADGDVDATSTGIDQIILDGRAGNDTLSAAGGAGAGQPSAKSLTVYGGPGADTLASGAGGATMHGDKEDEEVIAATAGKDTLVGGAGMEMMMGDGGDDVLLGQGGDDFLINEAGDDTLDGGDGLDIFYEHNGGAAVTANGADRIRGGDGFDRVNFGERAVNMVVKLDDLRNDGADTSTPADGVAEEKDDVGSDVEDVVTGTGDDLLSGRSTAAADTEHHFYGDGGNDTLRGGGGADTLWGGSGADSIEGGTGADEIDGNNDDDKVNGGDGADVVAGGFGADVLYAGPGDDTFPQTNAADLGDFMSGGTGHDRADYGERTSGVKVSVDNVANDGAATEHDDVRADVEDLVGGAGGDTLDADTAPANWSAIAHRLDGGAGNDTLEGGAGDDRLLGYDGDDHLVGGRGDDEMHAHAGDDEFTAGDGYFDTIDGGDGTDALLSVDPFDRRTNTP